MSVGIGVRQRKIQSGFLAGRRAAHLRKPLKGLLSFAISCQDGTRRGAIKPQNPSVAPARLPPDSCLSVPL
jgi:hypothetical protein